MWRLILVILVGFAGFWFGQNPRVQKKTITPTPEKEFPITEHKSFVVMVYAHNQDLWCERALRSIFEQEYDHYRVVFLDDGSIDRTFAKTKEYVHKNNQEVELIRNETKIGKEACIEKVIGACLEKEIFVLLDGCDFFSSPLALAKLNQAYQNPDVWFVKSRVIHYPSYEMEDAKHCSFYAGLYRNEDLADGKIKNLQEPIAFCNDAAPM